MTIQEQQNIKHVIAANDDDTSAQLINAQIEAETADTATHPPASGQTNKSPLSIEGMLKNSAHDGLVWPALVAHAFPLISLANKLRSFTQKPDGDAYQTTISNAVIRYKYDLEAARIPPAAAEAAHYILCATLDDAVLSQSWGVQTGWANTGLVSTFHMSVTGGERVFELLEKFRADPVTHHDLLLLIYLCLSLAFHGRTRIATDGTLQHTRIRHDLYKILSPQHEADRVELSPHWHGIAADHKPARSGLLLWSSLAVILPLLIGGYVIFSFSRDQISDNLRAALLDISAKETASIALSRPDPVATAPIIAVPPQPQLKPRINTASRIRDLRGFLQPDIDKKLLTLVGDDNQLIIRINNSGLFSSASAEINPRFRPLIERIGSALMAEKFRALVVGYTDKLPIRTAKFPSNMHLSAARARAVGDVLGNFTGSTAIFTQGRADSNPLADNKSAEGRKINRRTEIHVLTDPSIAPPNFPNTALKPDIPIPIPKPGAPN